MIKRLASNLTRLFLLLVSSSLTVYADDIIASYGFDNGRLPTVNDGFYIFEDAKGFVEPSSEEKYSGFRSLELKEEPVDGQFVELQAVFKPIEKGEILFHFAFFVRNPEEGFNIALAGPAHFTRQADGLGFWLENIDGYLHHHSDGIPKRLTKLAANKWYVVDVAMHIDEGSYDLRIQTPLEQNSPILVLKNQPNVVNIKSSKISKLSFIGDLEDRSSVNYYVDDIELRTLTSKLDLGKSVESRPKHSNTSDQSNTSKGLTSSDYIRSGMPSSPALGFLEEYLEIKKLTLEKPSCLPATGWIDFGLTTENLNSATTNRQELESVVNLSEKQLASAIEPLGEAAKGILYWRQGCQLLAANLFAQAKNKLSSSIQLLPNAPIVKAGVVALSLNEGIRSSAEKEILELYSLWANDARLPVILGMVAARFQNFEEAENALRGVSTKMTESSQKQIAPLLVGDGAELQELQKLFGSKWKTELDALYIAENYYFALLFSNKFSQATEFSDKIYKKYYLIENINCSWEEKLADSFYLQKLYEKALFHYQHASTACNSNSKINRKINLLQRNQ